MSSYMAMVELAMLPQAERLARAREIEVTRPWSRHTFAVWARALEAYHDVGLAEASARTGVPRRTLARWAARQPGLRRGASSRARQTAARKAEEYEERIRLRPYGTHATIESTETWARSFGALPGARSWRERSRYSVTEQAEALRLYCEVGPREAARLCDVSLRTIARWAKLFGLRAPGDRARRTEAATRARRNAIARQHAEPLAAAFGLRLRNEESAAAADHFGAYRPTANLAEVRARLIQAPESE